MHSLRFTVLFALTVALAACGGPTNGALDDDGSTPPTAPSDVRATSGNGYVRVSWTDRSDDETGFVVYRSEAASAGAVVSEAAATGVEPSAFAEIARTGPDTERYDDLTADPDASYRYAVAAAGDTVGTPSEASGAATTATPVTLRVDLATEGLEATLNDAALARYLEVRPAVSVTRVDLPALSDDRYGYYLDMFADGSYDLDLVRLDVVWTGAFAEHLADLAELGAHAASSEHLPALIENATVGERLIALPWFVDVGLLYYRTDLLDAYGFAAAPTSWDELETMAAAIQAGERAGGASDFWGYVWQGASYEGLTCNALEWLASSGGGTIVSDDGVITVDNSDAIASVEQAAGWVGTISPDAVTTFAEESSRGVFQNGDAAFMRNWPYAYSLAQGAGSAVAGLVDVAPLPAGDGSGSTGTLGGWYLAVPSASPSPEVAADLALFLTSADEQKARAADGYLPSRPAVYEDADLLAALPIADTLGDAVGGAVARPSAPTGADYFEVSSAFSSAVHSVLTGAQSAEDALSQAASDIAATTGLPLGTP